MELFFGYKNQIMSTVDQFESVFKAAAKTTLPS